MKASSVNYSQYSTDENFLSDCSTILFEKNKTARNMKTKINLTLTESKFLCQQIFLVTSKQPEHINEIDFISFANLYELQKINSRLKLKLLHSKKKFQFVFLPGEILALNYFAPLLIRCEAEAYLRIILDKIFQGATDQLHANILKLKYFSM